MLWNDMDEVGAYYSSAVCYGMVTSEIEICRVNIVARPVVWSVAQAPGSRGRG